MWRLQTPGDIRALLPEDVDVPHADRGAEAAEEQGWGGAGAGGGCGGLQLVEVAEAERGCEPHAARLRNHQPLCKTFAQANRLHKSGTLAGETKHSLGKWARTR